MTKGKLYHTRKSPSEAYEVFFNALQDHTIESLIDTACEFFGAPVILVDEHYQLVHLCPDENIDEPNYDLYRNKSASSVDVIRSYQESYPSNQQFYEPFYSNNGLCKDVPRIFGEVHSKDKILGHFSIVLGSQEFFDTDLECAKIFQKAMEYILRYQSPGGETTALSRSLNDLLTASSGLSLRTFAADTIGKHLSGAYALMVTPIGNTAPQQAFAAMRTSDSLSSRAGMISTIYRNCLVLLFGNRSGETYTEEEKKQHLQEAEEIKVAGTSGISTPFNDLMSITDHFNEAFLAQATGSSVLSYFTDQMPSPLFEALCRRLNASIFLHPSIQIIKDYDRDNDTDYFETLRAYSLNMHNKESTAQQLHIHRNTLLYRLNRISTLFGLDLDNPRTALVLLNSCQLLDTLETRKRNQSH